MNITVLHYDSLDSTNSEAANQARLGAAEGVCIVAARQTAGRGRHGRTWVSEKDAGLYFSIILRPKLEPRLLPLITLMTGVAVSDALREYGLVPDIKWVNDLHVNGKKIGGILAETVETTTGLAVIVGIGINITSRNFPKSIAADATSIEAESGRRVTSNELAETLTRYLSYFYEILIDDGPEAILQHWRQRSSYFSGKAVRVTVDNDTFEGVTEGLEENGALRVRTSHGNVRIIQAGDVERLRSTDPHLKPIEL
ncbi:MAG: biotin--[acetyl-CoA-carboxylase] ligase [Pyrinomonadaceae bacterium]